MRHPIRRAGITVGLIAAIAIGGAACTDTTADPTPTPTTRQAPAPEPTEAEQTAVWWTEAAHDVDNLLIDLDTMSDIYSDPAAVIADTSEAEASMGALLVDVQALKDHGPIPMASVDEPWQLALDEYEQGFELALTGTRNLDPTVLQAGTAHIEQGTSYITQATAALEAAGSV